MCYWSQLFMKYYIFFSAANCKWQAQGLPLVSQESVVLPTVSSASNTALLWQPFLVMDTPSPYQQQQAAANALLAASNNSLLANNTLVNNGALVNSSLLNNGSILNNTSLLNNGSIMNGSVLNNGSMLNNSSAMNGTVLSNGSAHNGCGLSNSALLPNSALLHNLACNNMAWAALPTLGVWDTLHMRSYTPTSPPTPAPSGSVYPAHTISPTPPPVSSPSLPPSLAQSAVLHAAHLQNSHQQDWMYWAQQPPH